MGGILTEHHGCISARDPRSGKIAARSNAMPGAIVDPSMMDVYLVPLGATRHELYCEVPDAPEEPAEEPREEPSRGGLLKWMRIRSGFVKRLRKRFREMIAEAERNRRQSRSSAEGSGWAGRVKARTMRWVAESIAEQRLLWHLRGESEGCLYYPDDIPEAAAIAEFRRSLKRDFDKHRTWMIVDGIGFVASGALMLIPGPNLIAYYFAFRLVGHYFSLRGARQGLDGIEWRYEASTLLTELRRAIELEPEVRVSRVQEVATRLRLEHLASFFERAAVTTS